LARAAPSETNCGGAATRVNALGDKIARLIAANGLISIADYMAMALQDPQYGYYTNRDPFGAGGDFITAPEVSQMFGELLGLWVVQAWRDQGSPSPCRLVELGPGRGTLMADALRAARLDPQFLASIDVVLIESSPVLREVQKTTLASCGKPVRWLDRFDESLSDKPLFLIANEFFDALPIRQFTMTERGWCERLVGLDQDGALAFGLSPQPSALALASDRGLPEAGAIYDVSPAGEALVEQTAHIIAAKGGAALVVDYGYGKGAGFGGTLQAVSQHKYANVLDAPGEADLTAHVDFAALARAAERAGARACGPVDQGEFLCNLGIVERAAALTRNHLQSMDTELNRLTSPDQMGSLFKALAIVPNEAQPPEGFGP
jgi:SAM-dependent MidA family methyltransferase